MRTEMPASMSLLVVSRATSAPSGRPACVTTRTLRSPVRVGGASSWLSVTLLTLSLRTPGHDLANGGGVGGRAAASKPEEELDVAGRPGQWARAASPHTQAERR